MTWWDYGNWILYISKRPVVANNFQIGGDEAARFFVEPEETIANRIMDMRKARYVIVDHRMGLNKFQQGNQVVLRGTFMAIASFADKDIAMFLDRNNLPNMNYARTMYARMHVFDGTGLKNYRMIYESNETHNDLFGKITKNIKIFEYVKGVKITGNASSNDTVQIKGQIITNHQRIYDYIQEAKADEKGYFEFVVPYSQDSPYETRLVKDYNLKFDNSSIFIEVSENDIINGNIIKVN
jgi:dolichyl-diphosphooligosaccharide--protein glycosyltransferase